MVQVPLSFSNVGTILRHLKAFSYTLVCILVCIPTPVKTCYVRRSPLQSLHPLFSPLSFDPLLEQSSSSLTTRFTFLRPHLHVGPTSHASRPDSRPPTLSRRHLPHVYTRSELFSFSSEHYLLKSPFSLLVHSVTQPSRFGPYHLPIWNVPVHWPFLFLTPSSLLRSRLE